MAVHDPVADDEARPDRALVRDQIGERALQMFETMLLARALDERQWIYNRQGRQAFVISCQGHEAAQVGSASALRPGRDVMAPYYRDLAAALAFGVSAREVLLEALSRSDAPWTGGRQMPSHYGRPDLGILTSSSVVASQIPHAVGAALAAKVRGQATVAIAYFGEGATSEGIFHESLNFAAIHKLPVIFFCENNGWAVSVPVTRQMPVRNVADRAAAYAMPGISVDGGDLLAVYEATSEAVERALRGRGPTLVDAHVVRLTPHSSDDDHTRYRPSDEIDLARRGDPIARAREQLRAAGLLDDEGEAAIADRVRATVADAQAFAEAAPAPDPRGATTHLFKE